MTQTGWRLVREIGRGAYGVVYVAVNGKGERAAVKVCRRDDIGDECYERELRGAKLYKSIPPQDELVRMRELAVKPGGFYTVMDLADDEFGGVSSEAASYRPKTLAKVIDGEKALPLKECVALGISLSKGLVALQRHHLLHRDIKPGNVIYIKGRPVISDPGLVVEGSEAVSRVGTPGYVPPEDFTAASSDIYCLGMTLKATSFGRSVEDLGKGPAPEADTNSKFFNAWWRILNKTTDEDHRRRYQSAKALLKDLESLRRKIAFASIVGLRVAKVLIALSALALITIIAFFVVSNDRTKKDLARRAAEIKSLKEGLAQQTAEIKPLREDLVRQSAENKTLKESLNRRSSENKSLKDDVARQSAEIKALKDDLAQQTAEIKPLREDLARQSTENMSLREDLNRRSSENKSLTDDIAKQSAEIKALKDDLAKQTAEIAPLRKDLARQSKENKSLRDALDRQSRENKALRDDFVKRSEEIKALKEDISCHPVESKSLTDKEVESLKNFQYQMQLAKYINDARNYFDYEINKVIDMYRLTRRLYGILQFKINNTNDVIAIKNFVKIQSELPGLKTKIRNLAVNLYRLERDFETGLKKIDNSTRQTVEEKLLAAQRQLKEGEAWEKRLYEIGGVIYGKANWKPPDKLWIGLGGDFGEEQSIYMESLSDQNKKMRKPF